MRALLTSAQRIRGAALALSLVVTGCDSETLIGSMKPAGSSDAAMAPDVSLDASPDAEPPDMVIDATVTADARPDDGPTGEGADVPPDRDGEAAQDGPADAGTASSDADAPDDAPSDIDIEDGDVNDSAPPIDASTDGGPQCPIGQLWCGGACIPSDAANCGACGHSCRGTTCRAGVCDPVTLLDHRAAPEHLAIDAVNLYWGESPNSGTIFECAKSGCNSGNVTALASGYGTGPITVSGSRVYWTDPVVARIYVCAAAGCNNLPILFVDNGDIRDFGIASDETTVFWGILWDVMSCPLATCELGQRVIAEGTGVNGPEWGPMAVSATTVVWQVPAGMQGSTVVDCPKSSYCRRSPRTLINHATDGTNALISHIAVGSALAVAQHDNPIAPPNPAGKYAVAICPLDGCTGAPPTIWNGNDEITALAADSAGSYWAAGGNIYACPNNQCDSGAVVLAAGQGTVSALVTDDTTAYFTTADALRRVAK